MIDEDNNYKKFKDAKFTLLNEENKTEEEIKQEIKDLLNKRNEIFNSMGIMGLNDEVEVEKIVRDYFEQKNSR